MVRRGCYVFLTGQVALVGVGYRCSNGNWHPGSYASAPYEDNFLECQAMLANDPACSTEWFAVSGNAAGGNGHCQCVEAGDDCSSRSADSVVNVYRVVPGT